MGKSPDRVREVNMPETRKEKWSFLTMMAVAMTIGMEAYNLLLIRASVAHIAKAVAVDFPLMLVTVMLTQIAVGGPAARKIAVILLPEDASGFRRMLTLSCCTVLVMCPLMSFAATCYFKRNVGELSSVWLTTFLCNLPMAFFWQLVVAGPLVRRTFRHCFR